jgi:hypothetical protein
MAKKPPEGSITAWFYNVYESKPELLKSTTNKDVLEQWQAEHPGQELTPRVLCALANVKSMLRKKYKIGPRFSGGEDPRPPSV